MKEQKIIELASRLLTAGVTQDSEEFKRISLELAAELRQQTDEGERDGARPSEENEAVGFLKFSIKEISKMKKSFSKTFIQNGRIVHYRRRVRGSNSLSYEIRYRRDGYNISVSAPDLQMAKEKFIEAVNRPLADGGALNVPTAFCDFSEYYLSKFYERKVCSETFKTQIGRYNNHVKPYFGNVQIKRITPEACQNLLDSLTERKLGKTADEVKSLLNGIFTCAIKHQILKFNPLDVIVYTQHQCVTGVAFSKLEEWELLSGTAGTPYQLMFAVILYTGLRPNEYKTARIEGKFIIAVNSKRKNGKIEYKKIPISPMLRPYLADVDELHFYVVNRISEKLHKFFPKHTLKDMRKTFNTRCQECGVLDVARKLFMGHSLGKLDNTYTGVSDEFLLQEGEKLKYEYEVAPKLPPKANKIEE